ncbi:neuroblast differentiation-associated protein AHNAK [Hemiscyllium ocellatum]|uniref:neuroblast differentiation-associated protein AHNAK n=1 Tax=Hemiscyllium ocellatum TaxID=170820 RepID=UPI0029676647|nr:neuroblast differentiation-associated protein AHNAK [Hemiscyllium ocellatum]XP_060687317.1 neuroblast differentiation-associated protein AHNAK [Hemiscyllium ocellatum]
MNFGFNKTMGVTLPGNIGALSEELTLTDTNDGNVIIEDIQKDSPVARAGTLKKGDQLNAVTIHFDNLTSEEVSKILKYSEQYKTSLKLNAKEELRSPDFRLSSPDMGSGDQAYLKLYNSKIKPHLKLAKPNLSVGSLNGEVNVKNKTSFGIKEPKIYSPDIDMKLKATEDNGLKLPTSNIDLEAPNIQAKVKSPTLDIDSPRFKSTKLEGKIKSSGYQIPSISISRNKSKMPEMDVSGPDLNTSNIDIGGVNIPETNLKMPKVQMSSFDLSGPKIPDVDVDGSVKRPGFDVSVPNVKGNFAAPNVDVSFPKGDINIPDTDLNKQKFTMPKFNMASANLSAPDVKVNMKTPTVTSELDSKLEVPNIKKPSVDISGLEGPNVNLDGKVKLPKADIPNPKIKGGGGSGHLNFKTPRISGDYDMPDMNLEVPDVKLKNPGLKAPSLNLSGKNISTSDVHVSLPTGNIDVATPKIQTNVRSPNLDINAPKVDGPSAHKKFKFPKFKRPIFSISGNKPKMPERDATAPDLKTDFKGPEVDVGGLKGNVDVPDARWKMPSLKGPSFGVSGPKGPDVDVDGSIKAPRVDVAVPNVKGNIEGPDVDINVPKGDIDANIPDAKLKGGNFKLPGFKMPSGKLSLSGTNTGLKMPRGQVDLSASDVQGDISGPSLDMKGPNLDINAPSVDLPEAKSKWSMPKLELPSFGLSTPKGPDVDVDASVKAPGFDLSVPNVKGDFAAPNVDVNLPKADIDANIPAAELKGGKFKMPKFNMPSANLSAPDLNLNMKTPTVASDLDAGLKVPKLKKPNVDISGPDVNLDGKVKLPKADITTPEIKGGIGSGGLDFKTPRIGGDFDMPDMNLEVPDIKLKDPGTKKPSLNMSAGNISIPNMDVSLPTGNIDVAAPKLQADVKTPHLDINAPNAGDFNAEGKFKLPKFKKPTFSISGNKPKMPELDATAPDLKTDFKGPEIGIEGLKGNVDVPDAKWKMPSLKGPSFGVSGPNVDVDGSIKAPRVDVAVPNVKGNIEGPDVDINVPKGDIDANIPDAKLKGGKLKLPEFNMPSGKLSLSGTNTGLKMPKGQVDLSAPDVQGDISGPSLDMKGPNLAINAPSVDLPEAKSKWSMPKLELPSFGLSTPKGPDVDVDASVKAPGFDLSVPNVKGDFAAPNVDVNLPKADIDANIPAAELKGGKFKMPKFNMPSANLSAPDLNLNMKTPTVASDLDAGLKVPKLKTPNVDISGPDVNLDGKVKLPKADMTTPEIKGGIGSGGLDFKTPRIGGDFNMPDMNLEVPDIKLKGPGIKKPSLNMSAGNISVPNMDVNVPTGNIDMASPNIQADAKTPHLDINAPNVDDFNAEGKFKFPKFKWPTFSISGNKPKMPELDATAPDLKTDFKGPEVDIGGLKGNVDVPDASWKMPSLKGPSFGVSGPNVDVDGSIKAPRVDVAVPNVKGNIEGPDVGINVPEGDIDANIPDAKLKGGKFKLPGFNMPSGKLSLSGTNTGLKMPKGQVDLSAPDVQGDISGPSLDMKGPNLDINAPSVDLPEAKSKWSMPKLELPSFGLSTPKGPDVDVDGSVKAPGFDLSVPNVKGDFAAPNVDVNLPKADIDANIPVAELKGGKFKMPKFNMPSANLSAPDLNLNMKTPTVASDLDAGLKLPKFKKPNVDISGPDVNLDGKVKLPKADMTTPEIKGGIGSGGLDFKTPRIGGDYDMPDMNLEVPDIKLKGPGIKKPSLNMSAGNISIPNMDVSLPTGNIDVANPKIQADAKTPHLDINAPNVGDFNAEGKFKFPKFKKPAFSISGNKPKKLELDATAPDLKTDFKGPEVDIGGLKRNVDVPDAKWKMPSLKVPSFGVSGPNVDVDGSIKAPRVDVAVPNVKGNIEGPDVDINVPKGDIDANIPDAKLKGGKFKLPGFNMPSGKLSLSGTNTGLKMPKGQVDLSAPNVQGDISGPSLDMKGPNLDINAPSVDLPEAKSKWSMPKLELPSFGLSTPKGPDVDVDASVKAPGFDLSVPNVKGDFAAPNVDVNLPKADIDANIPAAELKGGKFKMPKFNMPSANLSAPDLNLNMKTPTVASDLDAGLKVPKFKKPNVDISGPDVNLDGKVKLPKANITAPSIKGGIEPGGLNFKTPKIGGDYDMPDMDLEVPDIKLKGPGIKKPSLNMSAGNISIPNMDVSLPTGNIDVAAPKLQADAKTPHLDINAPNIGDFNAEGKFKLPKFKWPTFSISGNKPKMPELDATAPDLKTDFKGPEVDIGGLKGNADFPDAKWKMPSLKGPSFGVSGPNVDVDGSIKAPRVDVAVPNVKGNIEGPDVDINVPKGDIDANIPDAKLKGGKFKLPGFNMPSGKLSLSGTNTRLKMSKGQVDLPAPDVQGDISGPSLDMKGPNLDINAPSVDLPEAKSKWSMPKLELPSFGLSTPKGPDVDVDASVKAPGFDLSVPNVKGGFAAPNVDVNLPKADIDANIPAAELKGGKFKMPKFNMPSANLSAPDLNLNMKTPTVASDLDAGLKVPKLKKPNIDISGPEGPDVNLDGKVKLPKADITTPEIKGGIGSGGLDFKTPRIGGDYDMPDMDVSVPTANIDVATPKLQADVKTPHLDINAPNVDDFNAEGKFKSPKFKKPTFSISGNKPKMPERDATAPDLKTDFKGPEVDVGGLKGNVDVPDASWKMPSLKGPSFGVSGPKGPDVDFDGSIKAPRVDVDVPNVKGNIEGPDVDINVPKGNIDANIPDAKLKGENFKLPGFNMPSGKLSLSGTNTGLKMPKGQVDLSVPDVQGDISGPSLDMKGANIDISASSVDLPEAKSKWKMPNLETPSFNLSGPYRPDVGVDGSVKTTGLNAPIPNTKGSFAAPNVDIKLPKKSAGLDVKIPTIATDYDMSIPDMDIKLPKHSVRGGADMHIPSAGTQKKTRTDPNIDMKGTGFKVKSPNLPGDFREVGVDVSTPNLYGQVNAPRLNVNSNENINMQSNFSRETFKIRSSSLSDLDDAPTLPKSDSNLKARTSSTLHVTDDDSSKKSMFKFGKLFNFKHKSKGSVDFTKAKAAASSGTFTSKFSLPELELSVSKD